MKSSSRTGASAPPAIHIPVHGSVGMAFEVVMDDRMGQVRAENLSAVPELFENSRVDAGAIPRAPTVPFVGLFAGWRASRLLGPRRAKFRRFSILGADRKPSSSRFFDPAADGPFSRIIGGKAKHPPNWTQGDSLHQTPHICQVSNSLARPMLFRADGNRRAMKPSQVSNSTRHSALSLQLPSSHWL
jgi:hypothetical protein